MARIEIVREGSLSGGRYVARIDGIAGEAELTFTRTRQGVITADHTNAPDTMRGTGAAKALVERLVADARAGGFKIEPHCPYVKAQRQRHPEWADVMMA